MFYLPIFLAGVLILLVSANAFVKNCSKVWLALKISPLIIGATIVALGTSLPELIVSLIAAIKGDSGLAIGNVVGSNIINVFLVFGLGIALGTVNIGTNKTQRNALFLFLATAVYLFLGKIINSSFVFGLIMILGALLFSLAEIQMGLDGRKKEDRCFVNGNKKCKFDSKVFIPLLFSLSGVVVGGLMTVYSIEKISLLTGFSTSVLGLSLAAMATSLPELLTTIFSRKKDQGKIAIGNILGSNIYNLLLIGGIIHLFSPAEIISGRNLYILIFATICLVVLTFIYAGKKIPKKIGLFLLLLFIGYLLSLR